MKAFIGSEALASGALTRGQLRSRYDRVFPDVYLPVSTKPRYFIDLIYGAWLWSRRRGVVSGYAAAALHGVRGAVDDRPIELIGSSRRPPDGIVVFAEKIGADEICTIAGMPVTSPARTALDLARRNPRQDAVIQLDKLERIADVDDVDVLLDRYRGTRQMVTARGSLYLRDGGARTETETRTRLLLSGAGFLRPETNIELELSGHAVRLAMGWRKPRVAIRTFEAADTELATAYAHAVRRDDVIQRLGWAELTVLDTEPRRLTIFRVRSLLRSRGW